MSGRDPTPLTAHRRPEDTGARAARWSPWLAVIGFGLVSLAADMVYEGARSFSGTLRASLGASALIVGIVTGGGEALALLLRVVAGPLPRPDPELLDTHPRGYGLTAVCVPLLVACRPYSLRFGGVQVRASPGRRGRATGL